MPSNGKSSHCIWQGELKMIETNEYIQNISTLINFLNSLNKRKHVYKLQRTIRRNVFITF
jgi:hypothetical protein